MAMEARRACRDRGRRLGRKESGASGPAR